MNEFIESKGTTVQLETPDVDIAYISMVVFLITFFTTILLVILRYNTSENIRYFELTTALIGSGLSVLFAKQGERKKAQWSLYLLMWICIFATGLRSADKMHVALSAQVALFAIITVTFNQVHSNVKIVFFTTLISFITTIVFHYDYLSNNSDAVTSTLVVIATLGVMMLVVNSVRDRWENHIDRLASANQALAQEKWVRESIIHSLPGSVVITSFDTFATILWCNDRTAEWIQIPVEQLIGLSILDHYQSEDTLQNIRKQLYKNGIVKNFSSVLVDASGGKHDLFGSVYAITYEDRPALLYLMENVTVLEKAEQLVDRSNRMENVAVMSGKITHDFNKILTIIGMQVNRAKKRLDDTHPSYAFLQSAEEYVHNAAELVQQLRSYVRMGKMQREPIRSDAFMHSIINVVSDSTPEHVNFHTKLASTLPVINIDSSILTRVVLNIIFNAFEAITDETGDVHLHVDTSTLEDEQAKSLSTQTSYHLFAVTYLRIAISDTGMGMSDAVRKQIFDPFFTTKQSGSGLGLAATPGIVKSHDGAILVDSEHGKGTTITLLFPSHTALE